MFVWHRSEEKAAATLYHLAMLFGWDAYIYPTGGGVSAFISHDGYLEINTDDDPVATAAHAEGETRRKFIVVGA